MRDRAVNLQVFAGRTIAHTRRSKGRKARRHTGDRVWVLRQGRGPEGDFGAGWITGTPSLGPAGNGKTQMMAPVRFDAFVDPNQRLLLGEEAVGRILRPAQIRAQASGDPIDDEQSAALEELLTTSPPIEVGGGGDWTEAELRAIVADYFTML